MNSRRIAILIVGVVTIVSILAFIFLTSNNTSDQTAETVPSDWQTFKNDRIGIEFKYPSEWEKGESKISIVYWVAVPDFKSSGNIVLKVIPWTDKPNLRNYNKEVYKSEVLSSAPYYRDLEFIDFNTDFKIDKVDGLYCYYKGIGVMEGKVYYELIAQWWNKNLLYTIQGQFSEPELTEHQIKLFSDVISTVQLK